MGNKKIIAAVGAVFAIGSAMGAGFQLYTEGSTEALGQAGAISGRTNLTSLAWYNPAALAGAERTSVMAGAAFVSIHTDFKSEVLPDASMSKEVRVVPHFYLVRPLAKNLTGTLSINAPYGLITEWPSDWAGAPLATYSDLETIYITPNIAWRPMETLAVGAGFNVVSGKAQLEGTNRKVKGDDIGYGGTVSAHFQPLDDWGLGVRYQSRVKLDISGTATLGPNSFPTSADLTLPSSVNLGVANTSFNKLSLGLDLLWTEWSTYDELAISGVGTSPKKWDDVFSVRLGGEYELGTAWLLRAGYVWDQSPVPDETRTPELPGSNRQMVMFGFGYKVWKGMTVDAAYSYLWAKKADDATLPGRYETTTHLFGLSLGYDF